MSERTSAITRALEVHPIRADSDVPGWLEWVRDAEYLTDSERHLVLTATAADFKAAAAVNRAAADQSLAHVKAIDALAEGLEPYQRSSGETIGETFAHVLEVDPAEHDRLRGLADVAFPGGMVVVHE